eukprot:6470833-Amphidinium_carterae.1
MTKGLLAYVPEFRGRDWERRPSGCVFFVFLAYACRSPAVGDHSVSEKNSCCSQNVCDTGGSKVLVDGYWSSWAIWCQMRAHGTGGRPYPRIGPQDVPSPYLEEYPPVIHFPSEKGKGYFPYSCVPRFCDVGIPGSWYTPALKEIRIAQERKALYELLPEEEQPDNYPWEYMEDNLKGLWNQDPTTGPVERWRWEEYCYEKLQSRCYNGRPRYDRPRNSPRDPLRPECYVCKKPPTPQQYGLYRCIICDDVYMCRKHAIFPACIPVRTPICCAHSRWTRGVGSWNPPGGYPYIKESWIGLFRTVAMSTSLQSAVCYQAKVGETGFEEEFPVEVVVGDGADCGGP